MFNLARTRDQAAIDSALHGWWPASMQNHDRRLQWWRQARFGMFIHWGIYSLPGGEWKGKKVNGYAEHLMRKEKIPREEYLQLAHHFNPVRFDADAWVRHARDAGMKYIVITAKHHDGFAMYDSKVSDYNIVKQTPFARDPMKELSAACKKYGIKFGFYYSHAFDWEHPDAPGNDWEYRNPGGDKLLFGGARWFDVHPELMPRIQRYVNEKAIPQIRELIRQYHPDILWFDTPHKLPLSENLRILEAIRAIDTDVVVNGRLARTATMNFGDYQNTSDRPAEFFPVTGDWEAIPTTNESYGYSKFDSSHKPPSFFIRLLAKAASRGGNLLMNIGPRGDGTFDPRDLAILKGIGRWMETNGESIYGTQKTPLPFQSWGLSTYKNHTLYLQVFRWPVDGRLEVGGLESPVDKAYLLADPAQKPLSYQRRGTKDVVIDLPPEAPDTINTVIVVQCKQPVKTDSVRYLSANIPLTRLLAFDAVLEGGGWHYGDGKATRYYVEGWKNRDQSVRWHFRTAGADRFRMVIKYTGGEAIGGRYQLEVDGHGREYAVYPGKGILADSLGTLSLDPGVHDLVLRPVAITGPELMKLLELQLVPLSTTKAPKKIRRQGNGN